MEKKKKLEPLTKEEGRELYRVLMMTNDDPPNELLDRMLAGIGEEVTEQRAASIARIGEKEYHSRINAAVAEATTELNRMGLHTEEDIRNHLKTVIAEGQKRRESA